MSTSSSAFFWITALASLGSAACSAGDPGTSGAAPETSSIGLDLRADDASQYVLVRRDVRRCAAPACGGYFVDSVHRESLRCADGQRQQECYVADLDLGALGLSPAQESLLRNEETSFLLRGEIGSRRFDLGRFGVLRVEEAWRGHPEATPRGQFLRARNDGIVCITSPCLSFSAELLNRRAPSFAFAELDLRPATDDPTEALEQLNAPEGLLIAARRTRVSGPGGQALGLRASEFYLPFVAEAQACGSRGLPECATGSYCHFPLEAACGAADAPGVCEPLPGACIEIFAPVCGCDGQTYDNSCFAAAAGVSVAALGECEPEPQLCGSRGLPECGAGDFCSFPDESECGRGDAPGICASRPEACILIFDPVCGCDGQTYGSSCQAASAGVSVDYTGPCE